MERADFEMQQQLEEERLCKTLEALNEVYQCGLHETAEFLANELRVSQWWDKPSPQNSARG